MLMLAGALVSVPSVLANAQTQVKPPAKPPVAETVVVTAQTVAGTSIDRKTYAVTADLAAQAGSINDVLRNLPSVDIDVLGNVSLRGDTNVTVLIDGKPSTMLTPANRAAVMQQMPASSIEAIEVMTNPSAQYKADGSSGIINIITKKNQAPGFSGNVQANLGTEGRYNLGASAAYKSGGLNISGNASYRDETRKRTTNDARTRHTSVGDTGSTQAVTTLQPRKAIVGSLNAIYDFEPQDRVNAGVSFNQRSEKVTTTEHNVSTDTLGAKTSDYDRLGFAPGIEISTQLSGGYRHIFDDKGQFSLDIRRGQTHENQTRTYVSTYRLPVQAPGTTEQLLHTNVIESDYTAEYSGSLWSGKIKAGYDMQQDHSSFNNYGGSVVAGAHIADPAQTNLFVYGQTIHEGYATYEVALGTWNVLAGLRMEQALVATNQVTSGIVNHNRYTRVYPSLHVDHDLGGDDLVSFSYSHRVQRPEADEVNPYIVFQDAFNARAGNPLLLPTETHSFEVGYETKLFGANVSATAYWRQGFHVATDVQRFISPTVLLTTRDNIGKSNAGGLEFTGNGKISSNLSFNLSGNLYYNEISAASTGLTTVRSAGSYSLKSSFDYKLTPDDLLQISGNYNGRRLTAQGYRLSSGLLNLGYRHKLSDDLSIVATLSDVLNSQYGNSVTNVPAFHDVNKQHSMGRTGYIGVTWTFGGKALKDQFDYGGGGG